MHLRDLTQFLTELKDNNTRPWFVMNKPATTSCGPSSWTCWPN